MRVVLNYECEAVVAMLYYRTGSEPSDRNIMRRVLARSNTGISIRRCGIKYKSTLYNRKMQE